MMKRIHLLAMLMVILLIAPVLAQGVFAEENSDNASEGAGQPVSALQESENDLSLEYAIRTASEKEIGFDDDAIAQYYRGKIGGSGRETVVNDVSESGEDYYSAHVSGGDYTLRKSQVRHYVVVETTPDNGNADLQLWAGVMDGSLNSEGRLNAPHALLSAKCTVVEGSEPGLTLDTKGIPNHYQDGLAVEYATADTQWEYKPAGAQGEAYTIDAAEPFVFVRISCKIKDKTRYIWARAFKAKDLAKPLEVTFEPYQWVNMTSFTVGQPNEDSVSLTLEGVEHPESLNDAILKEGWSIEFEIDREKSDPITEVYGAEKLNKRDANEPDPFAGKVFIYSFSEKSKSAITYIKATFRDGANQEICSAEWGEKPEPEDQAPAQDTQELVQDTQELVQNTQELVQDTEGAGKANDTEPATEDDKDQKENGQTETAVQPVKLTGIAITAVDKEGIGFKLDGENTDRESLEAAVKASELTVDFTIHQVNKEGEQIETPVSLDAERLANLSEEDGGYRLSFKEPLEDDITSVSVAAKDGEGNAYTAENKPVMVTIKANGDLVYNGKAQPLVEVSADDPDVKFSYSCDALTATDAQSDQEEEQSTPAEASAMQLWSDAAPQQTDAGDYIVFVKADREGAIIRYQYADDQPIDAGANGARVPVTIAKCKATVKFTGEQDGEPPVYDGKEKVLKAKFTLESVEVEPEELKSKFEEPFKDIEGSLTMKDAGEESVAPDMTDKLAELEKNFDIAIEGTATVSIRKQPVEVNTDAQCFAVYESNKANTLKFTLNDIQKPESLGVNISYVFDNIHVEQEGIGIKPIAYTLKGDYARNYEIDLTARYLAVFPQALSEEGAPTTAEEAAALLDKRIAENIGEDQTVQEYVETLTTEDLPGVYLGAKVTLDDKSRIDWATQDAGSIPGEALTVTGGSKEKLALGADYTVAFDEDGYLVVTGIGNYTGAKRFAPPMSIDSEAFNAELLEDAAIDWEAVKENPVEALGDALKITDENGAALVAGKDYTVSLSEEDDSLTIAGMGEYSGKRSVAMPLSLENLSVTFDESTDWAAMDAAGYPVEALKAALVIDGNPITEGEGNPRYEVDARIEKDRLIVRGNKGVRGETSVALPTELGKDITVEMDSAGIAWDDVPLKDGRIDWENAKTLEQMCAGLVFKRGETALKPERGKDYTAEITEVEQIRMLTVSGIGLYRGAATMDMPATPKVELALTLENEAVTASLEPVTIKGSVQAKNLQGAFDARALKLYAADAEVENVQWKPEKGSAAFEASVTADWPNLEALTIRVVAEANDDFVFEPAQDDLVVNKPGMAIVFAEEGWKLEDGAARFVYDGTAAGTEGHLIGVSVEGIEPSFTYYDAQDKDVPIEDPANAGEYVVKADWAAMGVQAEAAFAIAPRGIVDDAKIDVDDQGAVTVAIDGKTLAQDADYELTYESVNSETLNAIVTGKGNYEGEKPVELPFAIELTLMQGDKVLDDRVEAARDGSVSFTGSVRASVRTDETPVVSINGEKVELRQADEQTYAFEVSMDENVPKALEVEYSMGEVPQTRTLKVRRTGLILLLAVLAAVLAVASAVCLVASLKMRKKVKIEEYRLLDKFSKQSNRTIRGDISERQ